jgi:hypothetical protein
MGMRRFEKQRRSPDRNAIDLKRASPQSWGGMYRHRYGSPLAPSQTNLGHDFSQMPVGVSETSVTGAGIRDAARFGTSDVYSAMPFLHEIQRSFGPYDVSGIAAHTGAAATTGARLMGARAFTSGDHVAFAEPPTLRVAAHEAMHVLQQRAGIHPLDGVGRHDDVWEKNADAVAERVGRGASAVPLIEQLPAPPRGRIKSDGVNSVQMLRDTEFDGHSGLDPTSNPAAGVMRSAAAKAGLPVQPPVAELDLNADVETVDRTDITLQELKNANVGHAWITLRYLDPAAVPGTLDLLTRNLLTKNGAAPMGFWPLIHRSVEWTPGTTHAKVIQDRLKEGYTPGAGASANRTHTGFSFNPMTSVPGRVEEPDTAHAPKGTKTYTLSQPKVDSLMQWVGTKRNAAYNLYNFNCTSFAVGAVRAAQCEPPSATLSGMSMTGVTLPNALYKSILEMKQAGDSTATTTPLGIGETEPSPKKD